MQLRTKRFRAIFATLLLVETAACALFVASRPPVSQVGWQFLEQQRPKSDPNGGTTFTMVADGLNFAVFRRPLGGWETGFGHLFQLFNFIPCLASMATFEVFQDVPLASSKLNSDIATVVFGIFAIAQCAAIAALFSLKPRRQVAAV